MWDIASPIMLGGVLMGNFFLGQFFYEDEVPDYQIFRQQARQYGYNEDEYMAALERVPRWSREKVETVMGFYTSFAEMIGNLSYANVKLANTLEERKRAEEEIRTLNQELEKRVIERTIELENTNANLQKEIEIRKTAEEQIKNQLLEKEVLLKEIHHRVKNNMQIIISILNLQVSFVKSGKIVEIIHDSQRRIKTMALIHEKLYQSKNIADINFSEYIRNLCDYLFSSYMSHETKVGYLIDSENINLDIDKTISLGLITNELVTNSFKYAFEEGKKGIVKIQLKKKDEKTLQFCISDNGKGFPENFDYRNTKSLGLQLVCILTEQIEGKLKVKSSATGTSFSISFPY